MDDFHLLNGMKKKRELWLRLWHQDLGNILSTQQVKKVLMTILINLTLSSVIILKIPLN